jgi:epsilon-lactone hydrolase
VPDLMRWEVTTNCRTMCGSPVSANGAAAQWTVTPEADPSRVLMFPHGGGYVSRSLNGHRHMVAQAGRLARARTLAIDYRLAPEHPFPAALDAALAAYRFLMAKASRPITSPCAGRAPVAGLRLRSGYRCAMPAPHCQPVPGSVRARLTYGKAARRCGQKRQSTS